MDSRYFASTHTQSTHWLTEAFSFNLSQDVFLSYSSNAEKCSVKLKRVNYFHFYNKNVKNNSVKRQYTQLGPIYAVQNGMQLFERIETFQRKTVYFLCDYIESFYIKSFIRFILINSLKINSHIKTARHYDSNFVRSSFESICIWLVWTVAL